MVKCAEILAMCERDDARFSARTRHSWRGERRIACRAAKRLARHVRWTPACAKASSVKRALALAHVCKVVLVDEKCTALADSTAAFLGRFGVPPAQAAALEAEFTVAVFNSACGARDLFRMCKK